MAVVVVLFRVNVNDRLAPERDLNTFILIRYGFPPTLTLPFVEML